MWNQPDCVAVETGKSEGDGRWWPATMAELLELQLQKENAFNRMLTDMWWHSISFIQLTLPQNVFLETNFQDVQCVKYPSMQ